MPPKCRFTEGEKVLCFHGPLLYEAKCIKSEAKEKNIRYFIHYSGWNKSWDEWVPEGRVLKFNDVNLLKQKELEKAHTYALKNKKTKLVAANKRKDPSEKDRSLTPSIEKQPTPKVKVKNEKKVLKEKQTDCVLTKRNQEEWEIVNTDVNVQPGMTLRNAKQLKICKKTIQSRVKKADAQEQWQPTKTLGGLVPIKASNDSLQVIAIIPSQINHLENQFVDGQEFHAIDSIIWPPVATEAQETFQIAATSSSSTPSTSTTATPPIPDPPSVEAMRKKRSRLDPSIESEDAFMTRIEVKVKIPDELKPWLVDDWDLITRQKKLLQLPAKTNVEQILNNYIKHKKSSKTNNPNKECAVKEVASGITEYFHVMLGTQLLYKFERPQYAEIISEHPDVQLSQVYGAIHLLRLFVRIGAMLAYTPLDERSLQLLLAQIHDFLRYMQKNSATLFSLNDYAIAPPEYHRKTI